MLFDKHYLSILDQRESLKPGCGFRKVAMNIPNYYVEPAHYDTDVEELHFVRKQVFVLEQQIPPEVEFDELDRQCHHVIARDALRNPIGTGRLSPDGRVGRMAVLRQWRQQQVGESLLRALLEKARKLGMGKIAASAQVTAVGFYQKHGFVPEGQPYLSAGIMHQLLRLNLQPLETAVRPLPKVRDESVSSVRLDSLEFAVAASLQLIGQARRQICIYSRDLEYAVYGHKDIVQALKQFALQNRNAMVQIIIQEPASLHSSGHPVLDLAQKLTSYFLLRTPVESEDLQYSSAFMLSDRGGYLFRLQGNRYEGHWSPNLPAQNRPLREEFERVWQRSRPCTEFRALGL